MTILSKKDFEKLFKEPPYNKYEPYKLIFPLSWYELWPIEQWKKFYEDNTRKFGDNGLILYFRDSIIDPESEFFILQKDGTLKKE